MESIKLTNDEMARLESMLNQVISACSGNSAVIKYVNILRNFISEYRSTGSYLHGEIRPDIPNIISLFKRLPNETSKTIAEQVKQSCKCCIFHSDNCMINVIFIIFKSLELNKTVEFKDVRPNMRILF